MKETTMLNMPIKMRYPVFLPCFLNSAVRMMPTMEDDMLGMGNNIKPNMDIYINIEYTVPLSVGTSKIQASPKAMTIPILTSKGMTIHNDAVDFFFIKSPQNRRCATLMIAHLG